MKRIFVCSPFAGPTPEVIAFNVEIARRLCAEVLTSGHAPYAPHLYLPQILDDAHPGQRAVGIAVGQAFLAVCDEVWAMAGVESPGMASDLDAAERLGKPVFYQWRRGEFDGLTVLATQHGEPLDLTPRPPLTAQDLRTAIDAAAKPGTFVIRKPTPEMAAKVAVQMPRKPVPVEPMPDDFRDTDNLDADVADFVAEVDAAISLSHQLPSKADDFSTSVREKLESIREWCVENNAMTEAQQTAVDNMDGGLRRWIR